MDDLQKLASQYGGTVVPEQAPAEKTEDLSKLVEQFGGTVVPYTPVTALKDVGKEAAAGALPGIYGTPEALQTGLMQSQRSTFNLPTEALNVLANPEKLINAIPTSLGLPPIFAGKEAKTELIPTKPAELALDEVIARGKSKTLRELTEAGIKKASQIRSTESGEMQKALEDFQPTLDLAKVAKGDLSGISFGKNPTALGVAGQFAQVFGSSFPAMVATVATKNPIYMTSMGFGQGASEATGNAIQYIDGMNDQKLAENSPYFKDLLARGYEPKLARAMTKEKAVDLAGTFEGITDTLGGAFTGNLLAGRFDKALLSSAKNRAARIISQMGKGVLAESTEQGLNEVADGIASDLGIDKTVRKEIGTDAFANFVYGALGGAPGGAFSGARAKAEPSVAPQAPQAPQAPNAPQAAAPVASTAPVVPEAVQKGLVSPEDLEEPVAPKAPSVAPEATPQEIEPELHARASMKLEDLVNQADQTGNINVKELNKLARDLDIKPSKDVQETTMAIFEKLNPRPVEKAAPVAPEEIIPPVDMGENTEYRVVKNDNGYTAVLVDKDANQLVTARNFGNNEEDKQKAIDYVQEEAKKAEPYNVPKAEEKAAPTEAAAAPEEVSEQAPEPAEEKTQAQINQERQEKQKAEAQLRAPEDPDAMIKRQEGYEEAKAKYADDIDPRLAFSALKSAGKDVEMNPEALPELKKLEEMGLIQLKTGKRKSFYRGKGADEAGLNSESTYQELVNYLRPKEKVELSAEAKAKQDLEDALADLAWLASKDTRMNMMPEDEQRLLPILTRLMDAAFRLGYHKFKAAAKFVRDTIREKFGKEAADKINLNHLQGAYIGMSGNYPDQATPIAEVAGVQKLEELEEEAPKAEIKVDLATPDGKFKIAEAISQHFLYGNSFGTIVEARKFISDMTGQKIEAGTQAAKQADEAVEVGVVLAAQKIAHKNRKPSEIYDGLVNLYNQQPNLAVRSSTSVREQAYSTPAPLAYIASKLAGVTNNTKVYEPTAGNGMLLLGVENNTDIQANELNTSRYEMLKRIFPGANITNKNAMDVSPYAFDALIANPPFGSVGETFHIKYANFNTREIDHAIALESLGGLGADPRYKAVLILGGVRAENEEARREGYRQSSKRNFYSYLYNHFNVTDHFTVAGSLYTKQGASYPVDVIVIHGQGKSQRMLPAADLPKIYSSYEQLKEKLNEPSVVSRENVVPTRADIGERPTGEPKPEAVGERTGRPSGEPSVQGARPAEGGRRGVSENEPSKRGAPEPTGAGVSAGQPGLANEPERGSNRGPVPSEGGEKRPSGREGATRNEPSPVGGPSVVSGTRVESGLADRRGQETETGHQVGYEPHSQAASVGTLVPKAMAQSIDESISKVEDEVGNVDEYVAEALHMDPETLKEKFSAEQVDALTLAIRNAEAGKGFIIGDQTGIGKGRVVAAMIKYAIENDKVPIFVTEKPNLYSDMIRDMDDIGMTKELGLDTAKPRILITNSSEAIPYTLYRKVGNEVTENHLTLRAPKSGKALDDILKAMREKESLGDYKVIFTTYSQLQSVKGKETERQRFIKEFGLGNYMIFDESHNAGGAGETQARSKEQRANESEGKSLATGRAAFVRDLVDNAYGTFFSSATYAKRPDVMDLYSSTDMKLAVNNINELADAIKLGGIPMQQIVANMLTKVGQYIRRERTFAGVTYQTQETKVDKQTAENMATSMRDILAFSRAKEGAVKDLQKSLDQTGGRASMEGEKTQVQQANFGSVMHNLIDQMLLSLKAQDSVKHAIESLKNGEKVVLTVSNTMGSFLQSYADEMGINVGDPVNLSFKDLYLKYLEKQRMLTIKTPQGKQQYRLTDEDLGPVMVAQYKKIQEFIENAGFGSAPISPIDYMHNELRKAGYKTEEITGRTSTLNYESGIPILTSRSANIKQRVNAVDAFNTGKADVIILNQAGSTGLSLHASSKFKDQRKRHMIIVQPEKNIDTHMQMLGRVHRTGQVVAPAYSQMMADIPAEMRPAAVLLKKMASLNANTTASRKSAVTAEGAVDFMNDYGGQIAQEYLRDNPEVHEALGGKRVVDLIEDPTDAKEDDIRRLTGYIPMLPIKEQEEIYKDLIDRYNDLVDRENSMGTNKLEAKAADLDAVTLSSQPITEDKGEQSLFAQPAYMEKVDVKRTVKPYSSQEVNEKIAERVGSNMSEDRYRITNELLNGVKERAAEYGQAQLAALQEKGADQVKIDTYKGQLNLQYQHIKSILGNYPIGTPISIKNNQGIFVYGVVTDLENKKKTANPVAGSDWKMHIALANGDAKAITINFSQIGSTYQLNKEDYINWYNPETQKAEMIRLIDLFDKGSNVRREKRWMVTGNILAGFASDAVKNQGQIMSYTKSDGTTGQGILMPRTYDFEKAQREAPIRITNADNAMRFMNEVNGVVTSGDNVLRISKHGNQYQFNVPSSKKEGGTFFLDPGLLKFTGDFYKSGNTMYTRVYDESKAKAAIDYILNDRGDTLIASSPKDKAREMFAPPKATVTPSVIIPKEMRERIARIHENKVKEHAEARRSITAEKRKIIKGEIGIDVQRRLTELEQLAKELSEDKRLTAERKDSPERFMAKALDEYDKGNISKDVLDVIKYIYNNTPALLSGLKMSVKSFKDKQGFTAAGLFDAADRLITLYKTTGAVNAGTIRHELMHTLEQMMDPQTQQNLIEAWRASLEKAIKKNTDTKSQEYFKAVLDYVDRPSEENFAHAMRILPSQDMYQYINPSEFWAVNAEKLMAAKLGTPWHRFTMAIKQVMEALKKLFGFNNTYTIYKTFNDLIKGETPRDHKKMLVDFIGSGKYKTEFLFSVEKTDELLAKHERNDAPIHLSNTVVDRLLGGYQDAKNTVAKMKESPRMAVNNMVGNVDRALLTTRVNMTDFTAGLTAADADRYGRMLEDGEGRAIASVAMNQALKAARIGTQVIMLGKLYFDPNLQMYRAVKDKFSMANILTIKHQLEKQIGVQRAANVIQAYFEAKRSKSIVQEYLDREAELENLKAEQLDPSTPPDRQLNLLAEIEEAQQDFKNISIALQKVNMTDEAIEDFINLDKEYPELKEMMKNWSAVNKNMIDMMEHSRIISKKRADTLRAIKDYVPWQRIQDEQTDPHAPIYGSKGVRNVAREHRFKEGKVTADIDDIVDNMLHNVMVTTRNSIKNYAANRIAQEYGTRNEKGKLKVFPKEDFSKGIVRILVNGRKIHIQIADPLVARSVIGIENIQIPMNEVLAFFANGLRRSITFSGVFQIKQLFMDAPTAALVSGVKNPAALFGRVFTSFAAGLTQNDDIVELLKAHGIGGYHSIARTAEHQYKQEIGLINQSKMAKIANILDKISDASDIAQRRAVYIQVMKETGGDQRKAILAATNIIDFDKRGHARTAQFLNRTISFMNAYAQQIDVLAQALAEPVAGGIEALTGVKVTSVSGGLRGIDRQQAMTRLAVSAGLLASTCLLYSMAVGDDDEYKKMDDQTKMRNFVIPKSLMQTIGYEHSLLIPMHTSASYFFKTIPELLYNKITKEGTKDAIDNARLRKVLKEGAVDALLGPLGSAPVPTGIKPFLEIAINHDFYTGGTVTPEGMKNLAAFKQFRGSTSELGKWMSAVSGLGTDHRLLNPMEADHIMRGLGGSVAAIAMWGSNLFNGNKASPQERDNILYGSFVAPEVGRGREDLFYDLKQRADVAMGTYKNLMEHGHKEEGKEWFNDHKGEITAYGFTESANQSLVSVNAEIRRIEDLPASKMTPELKRQKIDEYKRIKENILEQTIQFRLKAGL